MPQIRQIREAAERAGELLTKNPALFCRVLAAKVNTARPMPRLPARKRIGAIEFELKDAKYQGTSPMYYVSYALPIVNVMKRHLHPGDVFVDVGANIGYLSAVAANLVGTTGEVHSFEPVAKYHARLAELAHANPNHTIVANRAAAGEAEGTSTIYVTREPGQNTMVRGYKVGHDVASTEEVRVVRLDSYLRAREIERVALIKIDAEGFELPILKGLTRHLARAFELPAIICEIAPKAYPLLGRSVAETADFMWKFGYRCVDVFDGETPVNLENVRSVQDVLFLSR
jgi:FkbM family methyltransferase